MGAVGGGEGHTGVGRPGVEGPLAGLLSVCPCLGVEYHLCPVPGKSVKGKACVQTLSRIVT